MVLRNINNGDIVGIFEKAILAIKVDGKLIAVSPKEIGILSKFDGRLDIDVQESNENELMEMVSRYESTDNFGLLCKRMIINTLEKQLAITEIFNCY